MKKHVCWSTWLDHLLGTRWTHSSMSPWSTALCTLHQHARMFMSPAALLKPTGSAPVTGSGRRTQRHSPRSQRSSKSSRTQAGTVRNYGKHGASSPQQYKQRTPISINTNPSRPFLDKPPHAPRPTPTHTTRPAAVTTARHTPSATPTPQPDQTHIGTSW